MDNKQKPAAPPMGFRGPMGGMRGGTPQKAKNMKKTLVRIFGYLRPYWIIQSIWYQFWRNKYNWLLAGRPLHCQRFV